MSLIPHPLFVVKGVYWSIISKTLETTLVTNMSA